MPLPMDYIRNKEVANAITTIMNELNSSGSNRKVVVNTILDTISREHRTLQQAFWSSMLLAQIQYAENDYDMRNEQAVELAKFVKELAIKYNFDYGLSYI